MQPSPFAAHVLKGMSDQELQQALVRVAGPIISELARREISIRFDAIAFALKDGNEFVDCFDFRHKPHS